MQKMEQIRKFAKYFKPYKGLILVGILCILVSMSFSLLVPSLVGMAVDDLQAGITWEKVVYYPLVILGVNLASGFFLFWQRRLLINTSRHIEFDMRRDFYSALVHQPLTFFQNNRVGDLMARATNDLAAIRQIVGPMILYSFQAVFALAITLPILFNISVKLMWLVLIPLPFLVMRDTFMKVRVRRVHLLRIWAYSLAAWPLVVFICAALQIGASLIQRNLWWGPTGAPQQIWWDITLFVQRADWLVVALTGAWLGWFWWQSIREYLRLPHARTVAVMMLITSFLGALAIAAYLPGSGLMRQIGYWIA